MSAHPTDQALRSYGLGKLDDASAGSVQAHLEGCPDCRRRVGAVSADSFLGRLRDAGGLPPAAGSPASSTDGLSELGAGPVGAIPPSAGTLPPGLADHPDYRILGELGRGGMGVVYLARNTLMGRSEVLKVVGGHLVSRPAILERFLREIRSAARLHHPNVVTAYAALRLGESLVLSMEYVEGLDLARIVKAKGPLPVAKACGYIQQAALGLQHAHEHGMVHRDIKPANLILARSGNRAIVKVLDFGLAKLTSEGGRDRELTREGQMLGTPDYIAPEQIRDAQSADIRADIYSLGCTLYYLLCGRPPFDGETLWDLYQAHFSMDASPLNLVRPEVPVELAALVAKMMAKEPARRFQTPGEVARALATFSKGAGASAGDRGPGSGPEVSQTGRSDGGRRESIAEPSATDPGSAGGPARKAAGASAAGVRRRGPGDSGQEGRTTVDAYRPVALEAGPGTAEGGLFDGLDLGSGPVPPEASAVAAGTRPAITGRGIAGRWRATVLGVAGAGLVALLGVVLYVTTDTGTIKITVDDPAAVVRVDGQVVRVERLGEPIVLRAGAHDMAITRGDGETQSRRFVVRRGSNEALRVEFEPKAAARPAADPPTAVPATPPARADRPDRRPDADGPGAARTAVAAREDRPLPLNRWVELDPTEGRSRPWQTPVEENIYKDGVLTMARRGHIYFPSIRASDMAIRARVQIPRTNRVQLMLRVTHDANYIGGFYRLADGTSYFGFIKTHRGKWSDLKGIWKPDATYGDDEFVEFQFTVVGNLLTMHANGRKMFELRDATLEDRAGSPAFQVDEPGSRLKDIQVKVLRE